MSKIDPQKVADLRKETGLGMMECKEALEESNGDIKKAKKHLKEKMEEKSEKKDSRDINAGLIDSYIHLKGKAGAIIKLGCETDFVAKNDDFKDLAHELCLQITSMDPENVEELLKQPYIKDQNKTVEDVINEAVAKIGENIEVVDFTRYKV